MAKKTIRDIDPSGRQLVVRVDFNVPLHQDDSVAKHCWSAGLWPLCS